MAINLAKEEINGQIRNLKDDILKVLTNGNAQNITKSDLPTTLKIIKRKSMS